VPDPLLILAALFCGMASRAIGMPALIGYLAAGFSAPRAECRRRRAAQVLADMGITLLLFSIGLKLQVRDLLKADLGHDLCAHAGHPAGHARACCPWPASFSRTSASDLNASLDRAFAFTFSSTVFVIQIMQERGESGLAARRPRRRRADHPGPRRGDVPGRLRGQDSRVERAVAAAADSGAAPDHPPADLAGHGELFTLAGFALALLGAQLFDSVGIKGDLGALLIGVLLAGDQKAKELARNLLYFKDLFLVGFFPLHRPRRLALDRSS
jgi:glutathione-regulated potassium-efflux system ancillary protein KefC